MCSTNQYIVPGVSPLNSISVGSAIFALPSHQSRAPLEGATFAGYVSPSPHPYTWIGQSYICKPLKHEKINPLCNPFCLDNFNYNTSICSHYKNLHYTRASSSSSYLLRSKYMNFQLSSISATLSYLQLFF